MPFDLAGLIQIIALGAIPITFAITLHEASHGYAARHFGDSTAAEAGRISLNPLRHIDPVGTIAVPLLILVSSKLLGGGGLLFGWAKPVPVNFGRMRNPKRDMLWVAAAGPGANLFMAVGWTLVLKAALLAPDNYFSLPLAGMAEIGIVINVVLMILNLFPLPPLDGGRILVSLLPHRAAYAVSRIEPYGFVILIVLLFTGVLGLVLWPLIGIAMTLIGGLFGITLSDFMRLASLT
ncbi:MAG: site-2 protease family protein [Burkholderiales bacterium]|nr:site-2 protease family protein [Burkholderiales bacterium]MCW5622711.1 site-2 protease family protein [Burkholderiales bacterium]